MSITVKAAINKDDTSNEIIFVRFLPPHEHQIQFMPLK